MKKKFENQTALEIGQKYLTGLSLKQLSLEYGCSVKAIANAVRRQEIKLRRRGYNERILTDIEISLIKDMWIAGKKQWEISKEFDVCQQSISQILRKQGLETQRTRLGSKNKLWVQRKRITPDGYVKIKLKPEDPLFNMCCEKKGCYALEHRIVMARSLNRPLESHETIHHINGIRSDNRLENLQLRSSGQTCQCKDCGSLNIKYLNI